MKAVISNRIYLDVTDDLREELDESLTFSIPRYRKDLPPEIIKTARIINSNIISIPSGRLNLVPDTHNIIDKRITTKAKFPELKFPLRIDQKVIYDKIKDSCIINAPPSWGKTFVGISIAAKLGLKTLIVTHNVMLRNQWAKEVKKLLGITPGIVGSGIYNISDIITVGNIQTVSNRALDLAKEFGCIIIDECHHTPATTFFNILDTSHARYKIGLSATIERKDKKHVLFPNYFTETVHKASRANAMNPSVEVVRVPIRFPDGGDAWANRLTSLLENMEYRKYLIGIANAYASRGHKVLIVAPRVSFLNHCAAIANKAIAVTSKVSPEIRETLEHKILSGEIDQIWATQSIFSEGISVNPLSCLILGGPVNNDPLLEQLIGRVERKLEGKLDPVVVDIHLIGKTVQRQASNRMNHYIKKGYDIAFMNN